MAFVALHTVQDASDLENDSLERAEQIRFEWCHNVNFIDFRESSSRFASTLTTVEFSGYTIFENVVYVLSYCRQLRNLHFGTLGFCSYQPDLLSLIPPIKVGIEEVKLRGNGLLTIHELFLLKFLRECVQFKNLRRVTLPQGTSYLPLGEDNDYMDIPEHETALYSWLVMNSEHLEMLEVERPGIFLTPQFEAEYMPRTQDIQLKSFTFRANSKGLKSLLDCQKRLTELKVLKTIGNSESQQQVVMDFIFGSTNPLQSIYFEHKVTYTLEDHGLGNTDQFEVHDCRIYSGCQFLTELQINVSCSLSLDMTERRRRRPGSVSNTGLLPLSLESLSIKCDTITSEELQSLQQRLLQMSSLKLLIIEGHRIMPAMELDSTFIIGLIENHTGLKVLEFKYCQVPDAENLQAYIETSPAAGHVLELGINTISFRRIDRRTVVSEVSMADDIEDTVVNHAWPTED